MSIRRSQRSRLVRLRDVAITLLASAALLGVWLLLRTKG